MKCLETSFITPDCDYILNFISIEANIYINDNKVNIKAVGGGYFDMEICLMYGK